MQHRQNLDENPYAENQLELLRERIDHLDNYLLELLSERMDIVRDIAEYKRENNLAIVQPSRWTEILESRLSTGMRKKLTEKFIKELFHAVHKESIHHQTEVMLENEKQATEEQ
ncbi:MAG: chorismate mutase [Chitinophagales bacterium]